MGSPSKGKDTFLFLCISNAKCSAWHLYDSNEKLMNKNNMANIIVFRVQSSSLSQW